MSEVPQYMQQEPKSRKGLWITLGIVAVVLVGICGAGAIALLSWGKNKVQESTASSASPSPKQEEPKKAGFTLAAPDTIGARKRESDSESAGALQQLQMFSSAFGGESGAVIAMYSEPGNKNQLVVFAFPIPNNRTDAQPSLDLLFNTLGASLGGSTVDNSTAVDAGKLGGEASCGETKAEGSTVAMCAWSDSDTLGMLVFENSTLAKAKAEFTSIREQIERRP